MTMQLATYSDGERPEARHLQTSRQTGSWYIAEKVQLCFFCVRRSKTSRDVAIAV